MELQDRKLHWEQFYATHPEQELSWFEAVPTLSLEMIRSSARSKSDSIVDIGGGNSRLVDCLLAEGYGNLAVLDVSSGALAIAQARETGQPRCSGSNPMCLRGNALRRLTSGTTGPSTIF